MATRDASKTLSTVPSVPDTAPEDFGQRKRPEAGRFRLLVDRQLKKSYTTPEAAEAAGLAIKKGHPIVQVAIYDADEGINKDIELPTA